MGGCRRPAEEEAEVRGKRGREAGSGEGAGPECGDPSETDRAGPQVAGDVWREHSPAGPFTLDF